VAVDGDVVVVPAEGYEVVGVVVAALGAVADVMDLEPVAAGAAVDDTAAVAMEDVAAGGGWDRAGRVGGPQRPASVGLDDLDSSAAQDAFQRCRADSGSGGDLGASFASCVGGEGGVGENDQEGFGRVVVASVVGSRESCAKETRASAMRVPGEARSASPGSGNSSARWRSACSTMVPSKPGSWNHPR
jgi:hypothetical protein